MNFQIKFLKSKEGSAMAQMGDYAACERAVNNLNGAYAFGNKLVLGYVASILPSVRPLLLKKRGVVPGTVSFFRLQLFEAGVSAGRSEPARFDGRHVILHGFHGQQKQPLCDARGCR